MRQNDNRVQEKASFLLKLTLCIMLVMLGRMWQLAILQHNERQELAKRPQHRSIVEPALRASLRDRNNQALAQNRSQYNITILYQTLKDLPRISWQNDAQGQRQQIYPRKTAIEALAQKLSQQLHLDPQNIEDQIHGKAALFSQYSPRHCRRRFPRNLPQTLRNC